MAVPRRIVIVGSGFAGASAATELRNLDYSGEITIFGRERHQPYELPALSKDVLLGNADYPAVVHEPDFYLTHQIELRLGTEISQIEPVDRVVIDSTGNRHRYDQLILATGSVPRTLSVPGARLAGIYYLRTVEDSLALRAQLVPGRVVVIIGAGWIGCEVAAAAKSHGCDVTVVAPESVPLRRVIGDRMGGFFQDLHVEHGVAFRLGVRVTELRGTDHVVGVVLDDGVELTADIVVVGIGAAAALDLARPLGLSIVDGGIAVDPALRSELPDVYAIGDIASHDHPLYGRIRSEHWANARNQGTHVAGTALGSNNAFRTPPFFFTDQYDLGMEYRGFADPTRDELVIRGDIAAREFIAFWLREGKVFAAMNVNQWDDGPALDSLVGNASVVSSAQLREETLTDLAAEVS